MLHLDDSRLVEPFCGGGAVFFASAPSSALLGDSNEELIACYRGLKDRPDEVAGVLSTLSVDPQTFKMVAQWRPASVVERSARMIYLNRTAFNGLWRVNAQGRFNVPFGCKPETRLPGSEVLRVFAAALDSAELRGQDYALTLAEVARDDVVYLDPPYTVAHNNNGFVRYNEKIFRWSDQEAVAAWANDFAAAGGRVFVSNAAFPAIGNLYSSRLFDRIELRRRSQMAARAESRTVVAESLFVSKPARLAATSVTRPKIPSVAGTP